MPDTGDAGSPAKRRYELICACNPYSTGHEVIEAHSIEEAFEKAVDALDRSRDWALDGAQPAAVHLVEARDAETGEQLAIPDALAQASIPDPASNEDSATVNAEPGEYTVHCARAFTHYEYESTTVHATSAQEACARARAQIRDNWDWYPRGAREGPVFVEHLERAGTSLPVPLPFRHPRG